MSVVHNARRVITRAADATIATAGALGGAAATGVIGAVEGTAAGVKNGLSSGSRSTAAAALTLGASGSAARWIGRSWWLSVVGRCSSTNSVAGLRPIHTLRRPLATPPPRRAARRTARHVSRLHASNRIRRVQQRVPATELVPGDMVVLNEGDTVAADARLLSATLLETSEASLTGQSGTRCERRRNSGRASGARRPAQHGVQGHRDHQGLLARSRDRHGDGDRDGSNRWPGARRRQGRDAVAARAVRHHEEELRRLRRTTPPRTDRQTSNGQD